MVHLKQIMTGKARCIALDNPSVTAENKPAGALGDLTCSAVK
jgi:hypothetical protein